MYFHAPCGVVLYFIGCELYANKEKNMYFKFYIFCSEKNPHIHLHIDPYKHF